LLLFFVCMRQRGHRRQACRSAPGSCSLAAQALFIGNHIPDNASEKVKEKQHGRRKVGKPTGKNRRFAEGRQRNA
jgi:hypothetical protein